MQVMPHLKPGEGLLILLHFQAEAGQEEVAHPMAWQVYLAPYLPLTVQHLQGLHRTVHTHLAAVCSWLRLQHEGEQ